MKGSNSRFSHRPDKRYSNSAHIQGGMVTDADLTEAGQLHQGRDEAQNRVTISSGVPAVDGAVVFENGVPKLQQGWIVAEGKQGRLVSASGDQALEGAALFSGQADLPKGPGMPNARALLYADLWERPVFAFQDDYLSDSGLHGAETSYRTRTMVQIKALPLTDGMTLETALEVLQKGKGMFNRTGNVLVSLTPKNTEIAVDDCDPCADKIDIVPTVPNALFRLEVVEVKRDVQGRPVRARFAWSMENAAEIETMARLTDQATGAAMKEAFARDRAVYQYFSDTTEAQIGQFAPGFDPVVSEFSGSLGEKAFTHVRRWDGCAEVNLKNSTIEGGSQLGQGKLTAAAGRAALTLDAFALQIDFKDRDVLAGDYWLIELRRFAPDGKRLHLVGSENNEAAMPFGIEHYFCALFEIDNRKGVEPGDAEHRRLSFPAVSDIPATHVSFEPECPALFDNAENVADALNAMCDLDATEVKFTPPNDCERFKGVDTVDEALQELCSVQDDTMLTRVLRVMMDWGVVCGIRVKPMGKRSTKITWTAGTMLDRTGRLVDVKAGELDLKEVPDDHISSNLGGIMKKDGEICLSFAADANGKLEFFLSDRAQAFGKNDPVYRDAVKACIELRKPIDFDGIRRPLKPEEVGVVKKMADVWANRKTLDGRVPMSSEEGKVAKAVNRTLADEYLKNAEPERQNEVKELLALAESQMNPNALRGEARGIRRMQKESAIFGIVATAEEEDRLGCECSNALTPCPPNPGKFGHLVPVACIKLIEFTARISPLSEVCDMFCRKQAMSWRAYHYYQGSFIDQRIAKLKDQCCRPAKEPDVDLPGWLDDWVGGIYEPPIDVGPFPGTRPGPFSGPGPDPIPDPIWPPIHRPWGGVQGKPGVIDPGYYINPRPAIDRLPPKDAANVLMGNGFDVVDTIDLDDAEDPLLALSKLGASGDTVLGREIPEPGDKVVMMARGGKAVDYVVIEKGMGKMPFETEADTAKRVEVAVKNMGLDKSSASAAPPVAGPSTGLSSSDIAALEGKLNDLERNRNAAEVEIEKLAGLRQKLSTDVNGLESKLQDLDKQRDGFTVDIEKSRKELADIEQLKLATARSVDAEIAASREELKELNQLKEASIRDIRSASRELEIVKESQGEFVNTMRREQPIEVVLANNPAAVNALKAKGVVTVGDLEKANARDLTASLRRTGLNGTQAKTMANNFVKRR